MNLVAENENLRRRLVAAEESLREMASSSTALRESERRYHALFEKLGQGFSELELVRALDGRVSDLRYIFVNPAHERLAGIRAEDAVGRTTLELVPTFDPLNFALYDEAVNSGSPRRVEYEVPSIGRWYEVYIYPSSNDRVFVFYEDFTERKRNELALRESEARKTFLLMLGDEMRSQANASDKIAVAARLLGERLAASRILYSEYDWSKNLAHTFGGWIADGAKPFVTVQQLDDYEGEVLNDLKAGRTVRVDDVGRRADEPGFAAIAEVGVQALLSPPMMIDGKLAMNISVHQHEPRRWSDDEVALVQEVAERLWAEVVRARAEDALRESDERFRQFAAASAAGLWIRNTDNLSMEFASAAIGTIYGVEPDVLLGDVRHWAAMIVPEDREIALQHLEQARSGKTVVHDFRIQRPADGAFRWIRSTDFPLRENGDIPRIGGIAEDVTEAKLAVEHQLVLLAELQHRVRNIMAIIRSTARRSADGAADVDDYRALLDGRLLALARVQALLTRQANTGGSLREIVENEVSAQANSGGQYALIGPEVLLSPKAVEVLTLAFHELATHALKYGALSVHNGRLRVEWALFEKRGRTWLAIDWVEEGAPSRGPVTRRGFGSDLIEGKVPYELGGTGSIVIEPGGARCRLEFPLKEGESILETDAPSPTTIFGGTLDMTGAPDLTGRRVLVVEDDYYIAGDTVAALRGAGATVLGPCPNEEQTFDLLESETPTHAVLDLNLGGGGPNFEIANALRVRGVPFIFLTGYDPDAVPPDLVDVVRLQKPVPLRDIVEAVGSLT